MEKWKRRAVDLLTSIAFGGRADSAVVPYYPQKVRIGGGETACFRYAYPEKYGISSARIYSLLCELETERRANMHSIMILCGGEVICDCSARGYSTRGWQVSHSMAKTVVGIIIGSLVDEGRLSVNMRLVDIFPEVSYRDKRFPLITVEHLLTMTSGVDFAEAGSVTETEWTEAFFSSTVRNLPGSVFSYNSMNSYILAKIAERIAGESFEMLAERRFFAPMAIKSYLWEKSPEGCEKGGWGLYMSPQSWAKVGLMMLWGGVFLGRRILSEEWVRTSTTTKAITPERDGGFNYAYQIWTARDSDQFLFNGMLGQNVWVCPKNDLVVVMTAGNNEIFQSSAALEIVRKYLGGRISDNLDRADQRLLRKKENEFFDSRRWVRPKKEGRGLLQRLGFGRGSYDARWDLITTKFAFGDNNVGMMPLTLRIMQNNLDAHLQALELSRMGDDILLKYLESGVEYEILVGLTDYKENLFLCRGEQYLLHAMGEAIQRENREIEYRIELMFSETASVRRLKIKKSTKGKVEIAFSETPNHRLVENLIENYSESNSVLSFAVDLLERRFGEGVVHKKIEGGFNPVLIGADTAVFGYEKIVEEQSKIAAEESNSIKLLRAVVDRFFKDEPRDSSDNKKDNEKSNKKSATQYRRKNARNTKNVNQSLQK